MNSNIKEKLFLYKVRNNKDAESYAVLYDKYVEPIYRFVYFKISNKEEAEDVTSEVFLKAWDYLTKNKDIEIKSFRALVYAIARNKIVDVYRDRAKRKELPREEAVGINSKTDLHHETAVSQDAEQLLETIKSLKQEYQDVIHLRHVEGLSTKEIAEVLDKKASSVRVTLHRAINKLKELLEDKYE